MFFSTNLFSAADMGYTKDTYQGLSWLGSFRAVTRLGAFVRTAILARLLVPSQFGLFGIASLVLAFLETITESGINIFLIQEEKKMADYINTAWVVSIVRGIVITLIIILSSPFIEKFFNAEGAFPLILMIALVAFIRGFINPARVQFLKNLEFKKEVLFSFAIFIIDSTVAIVTALLLRSPISLVYGLIAGAILEVILSMIFIDPKPKFIFEIGKFKEVVGRGKWVTGGKIFNYFFEQGDDWVVGKLLDTASLGMYQVAYKIGILPITEISQVVNQVTFPIYSRFSNDKKRLRRAYIKTTLAVLLFSSTIGLLVYIFAFEIVLVVLGRNWISAVPVLKILAIFGAIRAVVVSSNALFNSVKKQKYITYYTFASLAGMAVFIIPFVANYGLIGAGYSVLIGMVCTVPVVIRPIIRILKNEKS